MPVVSYPATGRSTRPITPAEAAEHTSTKLLEVSRKTGDYHREDFPIDSIRSVVAITGAQWLTLIRQHPIQGLQVDPSGLVGVAAKQDGYAKEQIAARLATPGLSFGDKAFTLRTAVQAFADHNMPERLRSAEAYLTQLESLGDSAAAWQYEAHVTLIEQYYLLGRDADLIRHGMRALERLSAIPYAGRALFYWVIGDPVYGPTVEALSGQPNARRRIERLNQLVRTSAIAPPSLISIDSAYAELERHYQARAEYLIRENAKLGTRAAPLVAQHWLNWSAARPGLSDSATRPVADGKIRLLVIGSTGCPGCVYETYALERLKRRYPEIEPVFYTSTSGYVGNRLMEPSEEIPYLVGFFTHYTKSTFPIGIWAGKRVPNEDLGTSPEESPMYRTYPILGKPNTYVVDGHGIIRRIFVGYSHDIEGQIRQTIEFLLREAAAHQSGDNVVTRQFSELAESTSYQEVS